MSGISSTLLLYIILFSVYLRPIFFLRYHIFVILKIDLMDKINAVITGVGGYVPDYVLTNDEISKMVDTTDEWIMGRIGIKERHILNEEGLGTSYMARKAAKQLMQRTKSRPDDIDLVIVATTTSDYRFPSTASILCERLGLKNAFAFDMQAVCMRWKRERILSVRGNIKRLLL